MRILAVAILLFVASIWVISPRASQTDYAGLKSQAEQHYREKSYARAHQIYLSARSLALSRDEERWVNFRIADTMWRAQAATNTSDTSVYENAKRALEMLVRDIERPEDRDRVWAEVQESFGDFHWMRPDLRNWGQSWPFYQQALDWWAASPDLELARERYIRIVWNAAEPVWREPYQHYGYLGNAIPVAVLENVLKIALSSTDRAHAQYLIAMTLRHSYGDWSQRERIPEAFEAALGAGATTEWYDDSLFHYAEFLISYGRPVQRDGQWKQEQDYVKALELYRRLTSEFQKGQTRYYDQAASRIEEITRPSLQVSVASIYVPDSEVQYHLNWRNIARVDLALYPIDLVTDIRFTRPDTGASPWGDHFETGARAPLRKWTQETNDTGDHRPGQEQLRLDKLPRGAYLIEATHGSLRSRDIILVTDVAVILKASAKQAVVYFCNAADGSPVADGNVKLWERVYKGTQLQWRAIEGHTGSDGLARFTLDEGRSHSELFAAVAAGDRQAFSYGNSNGAATVAGWRIYAYTDRPAYRPGEKAQWKFIARRYDGSSYSTPNGATIHYEVRDPRGSRVLDGTAKLNSFGSAWGSVDLLSTMPLGEYRIWFRDEGSHIGEAVLFRLEEYKLPEFKVSVRTPEENGKRKLFRLGERVEAEIRAEYYFGGAVANANVEVVVYQSHFYHWWHPPRDYPWYYEDIDRFGGYYYRGRGAAIKRETLKTDATGKATVAFDTPKNQPQDFEYTIEARVTDSSRREIVASDQVRVTRQSYYVYPRAEQNLYRPQERVLVRINTLDANSQPVPAEGTVKITRDYWYEIWLDPSGKEVKGDELRRLKERRVFPPPTPIGRPGWKLKFRGYQHDEILTTLVKTSAEGTAEVRFTPAHEGFYRIAWSSDDRGTPVKAEAAILTATTATTELGYRRGGLEVIVDKDTFRAGQKAVVMLSAPVSNRYILFSVLG
jgi:hypothetical protein